MQIEVKEIILLPAKLSIMLFWIVVEVLKKRGTVSPI